MYSLEVPFLKYVKDYNRGISTISLIVIVDSDCAKEE